MLKMKSPLNFIYDGNTAIYTSLLPECMFCLKPRSETVSALFSIENPQTGFTCIIKDRWMLMLGGLLVFWVTTTAGAEFGRAFVYWKCSKSLMEQDEVQRGGGGTSLKGSWGVWVMPFWLLVWLLAGSTVLLHTFNEWLESAYTCNRALLISTDKELHILSVH